MDLYEKGGVRLEKLDTEKVEFEKMLQQITSFHPPESRMSTLEDIRKLEEEWNSKKEAFANLQVRIQKELY